MDSPETDFSRRTGKAFIRNFRCGVNSNMNHTVEKTGEEPIEGLQARVKRLLERGPRIDSTAWLAPDVVVWGAVTVGARASLWPGVVVRADLSPIEISEECNLQDGVVIHVADDGPVELGRGVSCGHRAVIHACRIGAFSLVGMGAVVMDRSTLGEECMVAAGAVVPKGMEVPDGHLVMGVPGRVVRELSADERRGLRALAAKYVDVSSVYRERFGCQSNSQC